MLQGRRDPAPSTESAKGSKHRAERKQAPGSDAQHQPTSISPGLSHPAEEGREATPKECEVEWSPVRRSAAAAYSLIVGGLVHVEEGFFTGLFFSSGFKKISGTVGSSRLVARIMPRVLGVSVSCTGFSFPP